MGLYLDENCEETLVDSFSEKSYYVSHNVGVRVSVHRGDFPSPVHFWEEERKHINQSVDLAGAFSPDLNSPPLFLHAISFDKRRHVGKIAHGI